MLAIRLIKSPCVTRSIVPNRPYSSLLIIFSWTECGLYPENLGFTQSFPPRGYFHIKRLGGLGPHIKFRGKIWGKVWPSSPNKRKSLRSSIITRCKSWGKIPRVKFGVFVTYIFGGKIWGSNKNFRGKFWKQAPPNLIKKYSPGLFLQF